MAISAGERFGHYEILSLLGKGGMGEVWRARDTRLGRDVAIKVLPADYASDLNRLQRFEQEARATSALNHPNILTIHDLGLHDGAPYIVAELLEGEELRAALKRGAILRLRAMDYAQQVATGLAAAHAKGIVHRDLKPENLFVTSDGFVKILDFGLAKLRPPEPELAAGSDAPTQRKVTDPGAVMGTASYMSPEQARGQDVDARSDIFSLGLVLHEMLAGQPPFAGVNALDIIGAILNQEPAPLRQFLPDAPAELQRIVGKALRKDREQRYQHVKDLLIDLRDLKQELEFEAKLKGMQALVVPPSGSSVQLRETPPEGGTTNAQPAEAATNEVAVARMTSSAEIILGEIKRHKTGVMIGLAVLLVCASLLAYGVYWFASPKQAFARFQNVKLTRLTSLGYIGAGVSISPDGKFIAYVQNEAGHNSLWTKAVATGSAVQIVAPVEANLDDPTFSPDGNYVYYRRGERPANPFPVLYQIPVLGGTPKKVLTGIQSRIAFSPDGKQLAFIRRVGEDAAKFQIIIVNADGNGERVLATREFREFLLDLDWSPDGKLIAAIANSFEGGARHFVLLGIAIESGEVKPLVRPNLRLGVTTSLAWFKDGDGLVLAAIAGDDRNSQLWRLSYPAGELRRITNDLAQYGAFAMTRDNGTIAATQADGTSTLWMTPLDADRPARQLTLRGNQYDGANGVGWTPDGRIVYAAKAGAQYDLWVMNADGSNVRQLTDDLPLELRPVVSPDGRYLVFVSGRSGRPNIWRTDFDGSNPKQLTTGELDVTFDLSPDGRWVVFENRTDGKLYKVSIDEGRPELLTDRPATEPVVSPDGKRIACFSYNPQMKQRTVIIIPFEGGAPTQTMEGAAIGSPSVNAGLRWAPDGRSMLYVDTRQGGANIWRMSLDGREPQPVTHFDDTQSLQIWRFDLARDGKQLVIARGSRTADVVLISEVK